MDVALLVVVVVMAVVLAFISVMMVVYFSHPDDKVGAKLPKLVTMFGLWLAFASVLVLPYDVANSRACQDGTNLSSSCSGGISMDLLWTIIYATMAILLAVIIPFAFFFYESDIDPADVRSFADTQCCQGIKYACFTAIFFVIALVIGYTQLNTAEIPVRRVAQLYSTGLAYNQTTITQLGYTACRNPTGAVVSCSVESKFIWEVPITFPIYLMAFLSFGGWLFFTFFVGVGMGSLPMSLINDFRTRPKPMSTTEYYEKRDEVRGRAEQLLVVAERLQQANLKASTRAAKRDYARSLKRMNNAFHFLKRDIELLDIAWRLKGGNPLWPIFKLFCGVVGLSMSIMWLLHIIIFLLPRTPIHPFLNDLFIKLEDAFGQGNFVLFGVMAFAFYSLWLLACAISGEFTCGVRLPFFPCCKMFPMELGKTMMNGFLFNTWIVLLCAIPTVQFCASAFPYYSRNTEIDFLFGTQARNLRFFRYFWQNNVFIWIIEILGWLSIVFFAACPKDQSKLIEKKLDDAASRM